mgnify:CR=1 FL=1
MAQTPINFDDGLAGIDFDDHRAQRSAWVRKLSELWAAVVHVDSPAEYETYYMVGEFTSHQGAQNAIRNIEKRDLPFEVLLEKKVLKHGDGTKTSEMWAAIPAPDFRSVD